MLLGLQPLSVNSARSLLRSGLPAFGTTTAVTILSSLWLVTSRLQCDPLRVLPANKKTIAGSTRSYKFCGLIAGVSLSSDRPAVALMAGRFI